jgi:phosphoribosylglycinamide formyltransferase-1
MALHRRAMVVLISGGGSNLQAIMDAVACGDIPGEIRAVISNRPEAYGLQRARRTGIPTEMVDERRYPDRRAFDQALRAHIETYRPALVILAGFMLILGEELLVPFEGRMLNIHPSLLPALRGLHTHRRALEAGLRRHGASVHFVSRELDGGPVIIQASVPVEAGDSPDTLAARVLKKEHVIYPLAVRWFCEGRLALQGGRVHLDGIALEGPVQLKDLPAEELRRVSA